MYCPKCGDRLVQTERELACLSGRMGLSPHIAKRFTDCYVLKTDQPREFQFSALIGGKWFCPGCGTAAIEADGFIRCPECGSSLNEFVGALTELHVHA